MSIIANWFAKLFLWAMMLIMLPFYVPFWMLDGCWKNFKVWCKVWQAVGRLDK